MIVALCLLLTAAIGLIQAQPTTVDDATTTTTAVTGDTAETTIALTSTLTEMTGTPACTLEQSLSLISCIPAKCLNPANLGNVTSPEFCPCVAESSKCIRDSGCIISYNATAADECRALCPTLIDCDPRNGGTTPPSSPGSTGASSTGAASALGVASGFVATVMAMASLVILNK